MIALKKPILKVKNPTTGDYDEIAAIVGNDGKSSYDIAVANGFTGTENEFLQQFVPENILNRISALESAVDNIDVTIPTASANTLGGVKIGSGLSIDGNGVLSANAQEYTLPNATEETLGGVKVGNGLSVTNGVLSLDVNGVVVSDNYAGIHNNILRGDDLTNKYTVTEICDRIASGHFDDLYIGDYFTVTISTTYSSNEQVDCVFAGFDTFLNYGSVTQHHAVIIPKDCFTRTNYLDATSSSTLKSYNYQNGLQQYILPKYETALNSVMDNRILSHQLLQRDNTWVTVTLALMLVNNVIGFEQFTAMYRDDIPFTHGYFDIFRLNSNYKQAGLGKNGNNTDYWLGSPYNNNANDYQWFYINSYGNIGTEDRNNYKGIRPYWLIG